MKIFQVISQLQRELRLLFITDLRMLNEFVERCIRQGSHPNANDVNSSLACIKDLHRIISKGLNSCIICIRLSDLLSMQLSLQLFLPLYTILLSLTARILKSFYSLIFYFKAQYHALVAKMNTISITNVRYSSLIEKGMVGCSSIDSTLLHVFAVLKAAHDNRATNTGSSCDANATANAGDAIDECVATNTCTNSSITAASTCIGIINVSDEDIGEIIGMASLDPIQTESKRLGDSVGSCNKRKKVKHL